jgi:hypothetical protein
MAGAYLIGKGLGYYPYCGVESKVNLGLFDLVTGRKKCTFVNWLEGTELTTSMKGKKAPKGGVKVSNTWVEVRSWWWGWGVSRSQN